MTNIQNINNYLLDWNYLIESVDNKQMIQSYKKNIKVAEKYVSDNGVSLTNLKSIAKNIGSDLKSMRKQGKSPEETAKYISARLSAEMKNVVSLSPGEKKTKSLRLLCFVLILSSICGSFVKMFTSSPLVYLTVVATIFSPIVEELGKRIAIKGKYPFVYTGIFAGFEGLMFIMVAILKGGNIPKMVIGRLIGIAFHFTTMMLQKILIDKYGSDSKMGKFSWVLAVMIHSLWNSSALLAMKYTGAI